MNHKAGSVLGFSVKKLLLPVMIFLITGNLYSIEMTLPIFKFSDQYDTEINSRNLQGKLVVLLGCDYRDIALCRKQGRKLYWKLQNKEKLNQKNIVYVPYIHLTGLFDSIENYIQSAVKEKYESVFLDRDGHLADGIKSNLVFLRIFGKKGNLVFSGYFSEIRNEDIEKIYRILLQSPD